MRSSRLISQPWGAWRVNKVDASIRGCNSSSLNKGRNVVADRRCRERRRGEILFMGMTNDEINRAVEDVVAAMKDAGFLCDVKNLRVDKMC